MADTIDWPPPRRPRRRRGLPILLGVLAVLVLGGGTVLSYYVDALWFESLGVADVFWTTLRLQGQTFTFFFVATFLILYGSFLALKPAQARRARRAADPDQRPADQAAGRAGASGSRRSAARS